MALSRPGHAVARALTVASLALLAASSPFAQQQPVFRGGVDLVQIDVVALDKDGHPVTGLTKADFTLLDRKKPQQIETFEEVTRRMTSEEAANGATVPAPPIPLDVATNQVPAADRLVVMVLDDLHVFSGRTDRVKTIARQAVDALGPGSSISILFTSGRHSVEFTRDRAELLAAIDTFAGQSAVRRPSPGRETMRLGSKVLNDHVPQAGDHPAAAAPSFGADSYGASVDLEQFFEDLTLHRTMEDGARALIGAAGGRKAFVLISEGTANNLNQMFKSKLTPCEIGSHGVSPCYYQRALLYAVEAMQRANVSLYAFDARGYVPNENILSECAPTSGAWNDPCVGITPADPHNWIRTDQQGFAITAAATGGFAVTNSDDFAGGVKRMLDEIDHYYLLGFTPHDPRGGGFRPVEVTVNRPGVTLHYRQGYTVGSADDTADHKKADADPVVALSEGILPKTDLSLKLMAEPFALATGRGQPRDTVEMATILEVSMPRAELMQFDGGTIGGQLRYTVLGASLGNGRVVAQVANAATITSNGTASETITIELPIKLALPPGRYQLRASALVPSTSRGGSVYLDVDVPDSHEAALVLGGPFVARSAATGPAMATGPSSGTWPFTPSLDRRFRSNDSLKVFCPVLRSAGGLQGTLEVRDSAGRVATSGTASFVTGATPALTGTVSLATLPTGSYILRVNGSDGTHAADRQIGFVIVPNEIS